MIAEAAIRPEVKSDWRERILRRAYSDKALNVNALRLLMYLLTVMKPGELRYVSVAEVFEEVGLPSKSAVSIAFGQLTDNGYIKRVVSKIKKNQREIELLDVE